MELNPNNANHRKMLVKKAEEQSERGRKYESFKQWEIYQDKIREFVINNLKEQFDEESVKEIPVVSSVNLSRRLVDQTAVVYKDDPERTFSNVSEEQAEILKLNYKDMRANTKLSMANRGFKLQDQSHLWLVPVKGKLQLRVLKSHQITVIEDQKDPESAMAYIVSAMDKSDFLQQNNDTDSATGFTSRVDQFQESHEEKEALEEQNGAKTFVVWTKDSTFSLDKHGNLIGEVTDNPLAEFGMMPFIDIAWEKEFEYWVRQGSGVSDFTVEFNARLSEAAQVVKMQGFSQAVLKGPKELLTSNVKVGPNYLLKILTDQTQGIDGDFQFQNPGADIAGTISWLESILSLFLTSRGIDPKSVTTTGESQNFNSGLERLLAMIDKISASMEDFDVFSRVEEQLYELVKVWLIVLDQTDALESKYQVGRLDPESRLSVKFKKPEMIQSDEVALNNSEKRIEIGISSRLREIMTYYGVSRERAEEIKNEIDRGE